MYPVVLAVLPAGIVALIVSVVLFVAYRFERFVGLRYLRRGRRSRVTRIGLVVAAAVTLAGLVPLLAGRGAARELETAAVVLALLGGLAVLLFLLLRFFSVFTTVSTMGVVLGVASLVVVLAVTSGFEREFLRRVLVVHAHMFIMSYGEPDMAEAEAEAERFIKKLEGLPGLASASKFSLSAGEVMIGKVGANFKGLDLPTGANEVKPFLTEGRIEDLGRPAACPTGGDFPWVGRMVLGAELARTLRAKVGDCINVLVPFSAAAGVDAPPPYYLFKVVGTFRMGFHEYDARLAFIGLEDARRLKNDRHVIVGIELRFHDPMRALAVEPEIVARLGEEPKIMDWKTLNHNLFMALAMQKVIISLFLVLIIVVAAFNIVASLTMIVLSKVREIAILSSMGARTRAVLRVFLSAGTFVGFVGTGLGLVYGLYVCALIHVYRYSLDPKVYMIERLPVRIDAGELLFVAASTQLICLLATIYPAVRASRLKVVDGLRYT